MTSSLGQTPPLPLVINRHHLQTPSPPLGDDVICERPLTQLNLNCELLELRHRLKHLIFKTKLYIFQKKLVNKIYMNQKNHKPILYV